MGKNKQKKKDLEENDCPLSPKDWVIFLSTESHKLTEITLLLFAIFIAAAYVATSIENLSHLLSFLLIACLIIITFCLIRAVALNIRMVMIIKEIIYGDLTDKKEIRKRWKQWKERII